MELIPRQDVKDMIKRKPFFSIIDARILMDIIDSIPTVEERKESEWIILKEPSGGIPKRWRVRCPVCRKILRIRDKELWEFCPCCGTRMRKK